MTKYKLIQLPDATIVVSDEKAVINDWITDGQRIVQINVLTVEDPNINLYSKIIAGLPNLPIIKYRLKDEDAKKIGYIDVQKLAKLNGSPDSSQFYDYERGFIDGFYKAIDLNDKKFSEEELLMVSNYLKTDSLDEVLKFLKMPQIFDCEIEITDCVTVTKIL